MNKTLKRREEINDNDKWDLKKMISNEEEFDILYKKTEGLSDKIEQMKGHILDNSKTFKSYLELSEEYERLVNKVYIYAHMLCDTNTKDNNNQQLKIKAEKLMKTGNIKLSFVTPEILKADYKQVLALLEEENLLNYSFAFEKLFRLKEYTLSDKEEAIISSAMASFGTSEDTFYNLDNADAYFGTILDEEGKEVELTNSNYSYFMQNPNRKIRRDAFKKLYNFFENHKNTLASTLKGNIKENFFFSRVRGYKNPLEMSLFSNRIDVSVYNNLIEIVHSHLPSMYQYMKLRKDMLGTSELHMYDLYCDLATDNKKVIPFKEGKEIIKEALLPLGEKYINDLELAFQERWIDKYPNVGKKSGAYKWGCFDSYPYVLLNYEGTIDDVSTMAHELGHAMHSYYSNKNQEYLYHDYPIFLAEIASTVNEVLLDDYLYKHSQTKEEKIKYLTNFLDKVRTTIFRQTMFAEFEQIMYDKEDKGVPLTEKEFSDTYYELNKLYYGNNVVSDEKIRYEWARIPHFYSSFYVYQYATGLISALSIASDIINNKENAKENYLTFLSSGGSNYPLEILKLAGVDIMTKKPYEKAFKMFDKKLKQLQELTKE